MKRPTLLVIDDDENIRDSLTVALKFEGYCVVTARDGQEALEILRGALTEAPSLIILDLHMPVMDGATFLSELRSVENKRLAELPVILTTSSNKVDPQVFSMVRSSVKKPYNLENLCREIAQILGAGL